MVKAHQLLPLFILTQHLNLGSKLALRKCRQSVILLPARQRHNNNVYYFRYADPPNWL